MKNIGTLYVFVDVIRSVAVTPTNTGCTTTWSPYLPNYFASRSTIHLTNSTWRKCAKACEFDPSCVAVDWQWSLHHCGIITDPQHHHIYRNDQWSSSARHYHLVSRCNITTGQCSHEMLAF